MRNMKTVNDPVVQKILQMPCRFEGYEVGYDDEAQRKFHLNRAKKLNVKVTTDSKNANGYELETCEGTVENCIRFLREYIEADYGYIAGQCFNIIKAPKTKQFKNEFQHFITWLSGSKRFDDFGKGISEGDMAEYLK